jgi:hypothetical protein
VWENQGVLSRGSLVFDELSNPYSKGENGPTISNDLAKARGMDPGTHRQKRLRVRKSTVIEHVSYPPFAR